ncbi:MAG: hypothetical protein ACRCTR_06095 [Actinomycetota bacterium]
MAQSIVSPASQAVVAAEGATRELPMEPLMFGVITLIVFVSLLGLTWTFRGSSNKRR